MVASLIIKTNIVQEMGLSRTRGRKTIFIQNLEILDWNENEVVQLPLAYTKGEMPIDEKDIPGPNDIADFPSLKDIPFNFVKADVGLMIGINVPEALRPLEVVNGDDHGAYASRHKLGWALNGPILRQMKGKVKMQRGVKINRIRIDKKPSYKAPEPSYGPPEPKYGAPEPSYGPPEPKYGAPEPKYEEPSYKAPEPSYGPPEPKYGAPEPKYEEPSYKAPEPSYGPPEPKYGAPEPKYGAPEPKYGAPEPKYGAPESKYEEPPYKAPEPSYGPPEPSYGPPKPKYEEHSYNAPEPSYGPPEPKYGAPETKYQPAPHYNPHQGYEHEPESYKPSYHHKRYSFKPVAAVDTEDDMKSEEDKSE
eukprot:snap_masked-scaffold735_size104922-processed-gene-0.5 protein:Tk08157 transcript:snap_masked-scaffold735_size104922-processed-gene-0.5-mRNA-1 annotation:"rna-binding protein 14-like isoform x3"